MESFAGISGITTTTKEFGELFYDELWLLFWNPVT
jgi:hypothetical protein